MSTLLELTAAIVSAHVSNQQMSSDEMLQELQKVFETLKALEAGPTEATGTKETPKLSIKQAFKKDEVICMVCGKGGFKTLKRHLSQAHGLKPGQYRKQFGIPTAQSLSAKSYSESRRQMAIDKGLGDGLAKARAARAAKEVAAPAVKAKAPKTKGKTPAVETGATPKKITKAPAAPKAIKKN